MGAVVFGFSSWFKAVGILVASTACYLLFSAMCVFCFTLFEYGCDGVFVVILALCYLRV